MKEKDQRFEELKMLIDRSIKFKKALTNLIKNEKTDFNVIMNFLKEWEQSLKRIPENQQRTLNWYFKEDEFSKIINQTSKKFYIDSVTEIENFFNIVSESDYFYPAFYDIARVAYNNYSHFISESEICSFIKYCILNEISKNYPEKQLYTLINKFINNAETFNKKRLLIYVFKNTEQIAWGKKKDIFFKWSENPLYSLNNAEIPCNVLSKCLLPIKMDSISIIEIEKKYKSYPVFLDCILFCDFFLLIEKIKPHPKLWEKEEKEIFRNKFFNFIIEKINELNSTTYEDFIKNTKSFQKLKNICILFEYARFWGTIIPGIIPIIKDKNKQKNLELCSLLLPEPQKVVKFKYKVREIEIPEKEYPDLILFTENNKKIALEITRIDNPEEITKGHCESDSYIEVSPNEPEKFAERLVKRILEKIKKMQSLKDSYKKYNELWLYLYPSTLNVMEREIQQEVSTRFFQANNMI